MSEAWPRRRHVQLALVVGGALCAWAGWYGPLTPSICGVGPDSEPTTPGEKIALDNARRREPGCDGHSVECQFQIMRTSGGDILVEVVRHPVAFWTRQCSVGPTDNWRTYPYKSSGAASSVL